MSESYPTAGTYSPQTPDLAGASRQVKRQIRRYGEIRVPGFQPTARTGKKWNYIALKKTAELAKQCKGKSIPELRIAGLPTTDEEFREELGRRLAADLPAPRMVKSNRIKPSKSDLAAYRKSNGPDLVFA